MNLNLFKLNAMVFTSGSYLPVTSVAMEKLEKVITVIVNDPANERRYNDRSKLQPPIRRSPTKSELPFDDDYTPAAVKVYITIAEKMVTVQIGDNTYALTRRDNIWSCRSTTPSQTVILNRYVSLLLNEIMCDCNID